VALKIFFNPCILIAIIDSKIKLLPAEFFIWTYPVFIYLELFISIRQQYRVWTDCMIGGSWPCSLLVANLKELY
jgi:hypothetical protein